MSNTIPTHPLSRTYTYRAHRCTLYLKPNTWDLFDIDIHSFPHI